MANTTQYYIVPINVQGVRATESDIGTGGGTLNRFKGSTVDFSVIGTDDSIGLGATIDQELADPNAHSHMKAGVHLHWALPDAITHAFQGPDGNLEFPSAPNRWLVTRYLCEYNTALKEGDSNTTDQEGGNNLAPPLVRQWIIESNKVDAKSEFVETYQPAIVKENRNSSPIDQEGTELPDLQNVEIPNLVRNFLGSRAPYNNEWQDQEANGSADPSAYDPAITVISYYGPSFGAYYQNCATTFGLHDDFTDYGKGQGTGFLNTANFSVSYQVIGWYSKPDEHDILMMTLADAQEAYKKLTAAEKAATSIQAFLAKTIEEELQWQLNEAGDANEWPTSARSIYNGMALNIQWLTGPQGAGHRATFLPEPQDIIDASSLELAIGNNSAEAMSALISKKEIAKSGTPGDNEPYPELEKDKEFLFNAFQLDLLRKLKGTDLSLRLPELEEYLHSARFASRKSGSLWTVQPEKTETDQTLSASSAAEVGLPLAAAELLSLLNNTQREYDKEIDALHSRQHQAYLDYTSYGLINQDLKNNNNQGDSNEILPVIESYLTSELLKTYSESAKTGRIEETEQAEEKAAFTFSPTWTFTNKKAEQAILKLASAQGQWWFLYPQTLGLVNSIVEEAQASFLEGNYTSAGRFLQQIKQAPLGQTLAALSSFFNTTNNALFAEIDSQIASLNEEASTLADVLEDLQSIKAGYMESAWEGKTAIEKVLKDRKEAVFTNTNLLDLQQIYVELEAANYFVLNLPAAGPRVKEALAIAQKASTDITAAIKNLQSVKSTLSKTFASAYQSIKVISDSASDAITILAAGAAMTGQQHQQLIGDFSIITKRIATVLAEEPTRTQQGLQLQAHWQMLLNYLPTGHQVIVLVNIVQSVTTFIDFTNKLRRNPAEAFWAPNEPVLLITEPADAENILVRVNRNGKAKLLPCRQESELLEALQLNEKTISSSELASTAIGKVYANTSELQSTIQALLSEGYFMTPQASYDILTKAAQMDGKLTTDLVAAQISLITQQENAQHNQPIPATEKDKAIQEGPSGALTATFHGTLPYYIGMTDLWKGDISYTPFLPLFLAWSADFNPVQLVNGAGTDQKNSVFPPDYITSNFKLGPDHVDMVCSQPLQLQQVDGRANPVTIYGQITLSNQASYALLHQISLYFKNKGIDITSGEVDTSGFNQFENDLYDAYVYFDTKVILSQGMNGFNSYLLEQLQLLQLPVNGEVVSNDDQAIKLLDFLIPSWKNPEFDRTTVSQHRTSSYFLPLRAGMLEMKELYIVDAFGRYFQIGDSHNNQPVQNQLIVSSSMKAAPSCEQDGNEIYLPPRFVQPMQLSFEWLSSTSLEGGETTFVERTKQPAFSPVCGWIMPNHLDNSLGIYDAGGEPLGSLGLEGQKQIATWRPVPSATLGDVSENGRKQMLTDTANANPFFRDFLQEYAFPAGGASYFQQFLDTLEQSQVYIHSANLQQEKGLAVLLGRPLVMVRAELRLDLQGLPEVGLKDSFIENMATEVTSAQKNDPKTWLDYDVDKRFRAGFTEVVCPVQLGDLHQFDDGLVGFFLNDDWSTFFSPVAKSNSGAVQQSTFETIELLPNYHDRESNIVEKGDGQNKANTAQKSVIVTMLMDPRAEVHATSGILPVQSIRIPGDQYAATLQKLLVYFLANPVLMGNQQIGLPLPNERGYEWAWAQPGLEADTPLSPNYISDKAQFNYSPQVIRDGWLKLQKDQQEKTAKEK